MFRFKRNRSAENIDEAKVEEFYEQNKEEAEDILHNVDKMEELLQKLEQKLKVVPVAGNVLSYIPIMMSLVRSYVKKEYTAVPVASMISIVVALLYFLSPIDIIPDAILGTGYIDDAVVISGCLALVKSDLEDYRIWRKSNGYEIEDLPDYRQINKEAQNDKSVFRSLFKKKKSSLGK